MSRFVAAASLREALALLAAEGDRLKIIAGGTDLMVQLRAAAFIGAPRPPVIMDVSRLPELNRLEANSKKPYLGAGVTFRRLESDPRVALAWPLLRLAAAAVGSVQVRHLATIGGNVANASPAADGAAAITALGARAEIRSRAARRRLLVEGLIVAPGRIALAPDEMILGFELDPLPDGVGQAFVKVGRRQAMSVARMNVSACLAPDLSFARLVVGGCFPTPRRLREVEEMIKAGPPGPKLWAEAAKACGGCFLDVCGRRSSAPYKVPALSGVVAAALAEAWRRAGGET